MVDHHHRQTTKHHNNNETKHTFQDNKNKSEDCGWEFLMRMDGCNRER